MSMARQMVEASTRFTRFWGRRATRPRRMWGRAFHFNVQSHLESFDEVNCVALFNEYVYRQLKRFLFVSLEPQSDCALP